LTDTTTLVTRDTGETQIVLADSRDASVRVFVVQVVNAADASRHPFSYGP
jgi:hypothetical protein